MWSSTAFVFIINSFDIANGVKSARHSTGENGIGFYRLVRITFTSGWAEIMKAEQAHPSPLCKNSKTKTEQG